MSVIEFRGPDATEQVSELQMILRAQYVLSFKYICSIMDF